MLAGALEARGRTVEGPARVAFWAGYLKAMCDATGCSTAELLAWMDRYEAEHTL